MHKQIRWAVAGVILCGSAMAFGDEVKSSEGQKKEEVKKEKLSQEPADSRLDDVMGMEIGHTNNEELGDVYFLN